MTPEAPLNIYFAGDLFTHKDLIGNAMLAEAIADISDHRYCSVLPQNFPAADKSARQLRDEQLRTLIECDLALFNFDGSELEAGAVVAFMTAKFADIPVVILRTDHRGHEAEHAHPWSPMAQFFPRCAVEVVDANSIYENVFQEFPITAVRDILIEQRSSEVACTMVRVIAQAVIDAFDHVLEEPPALRPEEAPAVYSWLARFYGSELPSSDVERLLSHALARKCQRGLLRGTGNAANVGS